MIKESIETTVWVNTCKPCYLIIVNNSRLHQPIPFSFKERNEKFWEFVNDTDNTIRFVTETERKKDGRIYHREYFGSNAVTRILELPFNRMFEWENIHDNN